MVRAIIVNAVNMPKRAVSEQSLACWAPTAARDIKRGQSGKWWGTAETVDVAVSAPSELVTQHMSAKAFLTADAVFLVFNRLTRQDAMSLANPDLGAMSMAVEEEGT